MPSRKKSTKVNLPLLPLPTCTSPRSMAWKWRIWNGWFKGKDPSTWFAIGVGVWHRVGLAAALAMRGWNTSCFCSGRLDVSWWRSKYRHFLWGGQNGKGWEKSSWPWVQNAWEWIWTQIYDMMISEGIWSILYVHISLKHAAQTYWYHIYTCIYIYIYNHKLLEQSTQTAPLAESESIPSPGKLRTLAKRWSSSSHCWFLDLWNYPVNLGEKLGMLYSPTKWGFYGFQSNWPYFIADRNICSDLLGFGFWWFLYGLGSHGGFSVDSSVWKTPPFGAEGRFLLWFTWIPSIVNRRTSNWVVVSNILYFHS